MPELKLYAGQIKSINRDLSETAVSCLVQVYGWYDKAKIGELHARTPVLANLWVNKDHPVYDAIMVGARLGIPAVGVSEKGRKVNGYRGNFMVHELVGCEKRSMIMLNEQAVQDDDSAYTKTQTSLVVAAASEGIRAKLGQLMRSLF
jgi:hypothetical protein